MKSQRYFIVSLFLLLNLTSLTGQRVTLVEDGSAVNAVLDSGTRPIAPNGRVGQVLYPDPPPTPPPHMSPDAYYKPPAYSTFWIYPDGHFETIDFTAGSTTFRNTNATLSSSSSSNIYCFLTEKYINTDPPEDTVAAGKSNITSPLPTYIDDSHTLDLFVNNDPRPGYKMVTVMSYDKDINANGLYLFYNSVGKDRVKYNLFESPVLEIILPDYSIGEVNNNEMSFDSYPGYFSVLGNFKDAIHFQLKEYKTKELGRMPSPLGFGRKRIFSVLETKKYDDPKTYPFGDYSHLLGILTGSQPKVLTNDEATLASSLGFSLIEGRCELQPDLFIVGIDELQSKIVETHDPNHLTLKKVCREGDLLKLDYELMICNEFIQPESQIDIQISGLNGYIINNVIFRSHTSRDEISTVTPPGTFIYKPDMTLAKANNIFPSCDVLKFTVEIPAPHIEGTDPAAEMLINNRPFINYCVKFNSTSEKKYECDSKYSFNEVDSNYFIPACEPTLTHRLPFPWWKYLLIVIIIIPVVWYFFRRKGPKV